MPTAPQACCATSSLPAGRRPAERLCQAGLGRTATLGRLRWAWLLDATFRAEPGPVVLPSLIPRSASARLCRAPHLDAAGHCSAFGGSRSLLRITKQGAVASHPGAEGHCVDLWGRGLLLPMLGQRVVAPYYGAEGWCSPLRSRGALRRNVEHGIGSSEDQLGWRLVAGGARGGPWVGPGWAVAGRQVVAVRIRSPPEGRPPSPHEPQRATSGCQEPQSPRHAWPRLPRRGISPHVSGSSTLVGGGVSEWPKERASKARVGASPPRVRIPAPPPRFYRRPACRRVLLHTSVVR